MTQTTGAMSGVAGKIELSTNNSDYTDYSGWASSITFGGHDRQTGEAFTFDGDEAILGFGKRNPSEVTIRGVYTDGATDLFGIVWGYHDTDDGSAVYVRWSPCGAATTGDDIFTSDAGKVVNVMPPDGDSGSGAPLMFAFTVRVPGWSLTNQT